MIVTMVYDRLEINNTGIPLFKTMEKGVVDSAKIVCTQVKEGKECTLMYYEWCCSNRDCYIKYELYSINEFNIKIQASLTNTRNEYDIPNNTPDIFLEIFKYYYQFRTHEYVTKFVTEIS